MPVDISPLRMHPESFEHEQNISASHKNAPEYLECTQNAVRIFTARCEASAVFAVMQCPSVCLSVTFVDHVKTNKHIFEIFSPSGSDTILIFPSQRGCRYSDECKGYDKMTIFSQISRCISETVIVRWALSIRTTFSVIASGASPGETKMW